MDVSLTWSRDTEESQIMVCATPEEWQQIVRNLDGIGHAPATLDMLRQLKSWGVSK